MTTAPRNFFLSVAGVLVVLVVLFIFRNTAIVTGAEGRTVALLSPFMRSAEYAALQAEEKDPAKNQEEYIHTLEYTVSDLRGENERLGQALSFATEHKISLVGAKVMLYGRDQGREYLLIDIGDNRTVREGALAITENGTFVGRVALITGNTARISVASNQDEVREVSTVPVAMRALAKGIGARAFAVEFLSGQTPAHVGDFLMTGEASTTVVFPVAKITAIRDKGSNAFQEGNAVLIVRPELLREIFLVAEGTPTP